MSERDLIERLRNLGDRDLSAEIDIIDWLTQESERLSNIPNGEGDWPASQLLRAATTIARLSEALAEAEKKGADVRELPWERRAFGGLWTAKTSLGSYFIDANEDPCEWAFGRQDYRTVGSLEEAKAAAQADYEARVRACLAAPPRDLSQGGQHG